MIKNKLIAVCLSFFLCANSYSFTQELNQTTLDTPDKISAVNDNLRRLYTSKLDLYPRGILPFTDSKYDLGEVGREWRAIYVDTVTATTITATTVTATTLTTNNINGTFIGYGRNRIINGDMRIDQRNVGALESISADTENYTLDRWFGDGEAADGVFRIQRQTSTIPTGFTHALAADVTTADASIGASQEYGFEQKIEGLNMADLLWGTSSAKAIIISFQVRSSVTGTFSGSVRNSADNRSYPFTYTISSANTWESKTVSIAGDTTGTWLTTNGVGLKLRFDLGSGSSARGTAGAWAAANYYGATSAVSLISTLSANFYLTGVQLEIGSTATAFEYGLFPIEVLLCQRYFEKSYELETALGTSTGVGRTTLWASDAGHGYAPGSNRPFQVSKRTTPTMVIYSTTGASGNIRNLDVPADIAGGFQSTGMHDTGEIFRSSGNFGDGVAHGFHWTADAEL